MTVQFTLTSAGLDTGPFNLYSNLDGFITPFEVGVSKASLLAGYSSANVPDYTSVVRIQSAGTCANWIDIILENTTTSTTTGIPTTSSSTSSTSTTIASIPCGISSSYSGGQSYPSSEVVNLGNDTGPVAIQFNALSVPDRYIVTWNGEIVIDTGYRGSTSYDFGQSNRSAFKSSLLGLVDPVTSNIYPDFTTYTDDGYPRIAGTGSGVQIFNKTSASPATATVEVYGPMAGTAWNYTLNCPNAGPTTTLTTSTTAMPYAIHTVYFDVSATPSPGGWSTNSFACSGTGTPIVLYSNPASTTFAALISNGNALFTDTGLTTAFNGQSLWYKSQSGANGGQALRIDSIGFIDIAMFTCPVPTTTSTTTACNCDKYDLNIDTGDFITSFGNTNTTLNSAIFVTYVDCAGDIQEIKVTTGTGLQPNFCCALLGVVPQVTYWQNNVEYSASSYVILNGNCC